MKKSDFNYVVVSPFTDKYNKKVTYNPGDDVNDFTFERLQELKSRGLVEFVPITPPANSTKSASTASTQGNTAKATNTGGRGKKADADKDAVTKIGDAGTNSAESIAAAATKVEGTTGNEGAGDQSNDQQNSNTADQSDNKGEQSANNGTEGTDDNK